MLKVILINVPVVDGIVEAEPLPTYYVEAMQNDAYLKQLKEYIINSLI